MADTVRPRASNFVIVATGTRADVRLSPEAKIEFDKIAAGANGLAIKQHRQLQRFMERFCEGISLNDDHYKKEGEFPDGTKAGKSIGIYEFKPFKWRLYGAILQINQRKCFVGVRVDPQKKQQRADQAALRLAAKEIGKLQEYK